MSGAKQNFFGNRLEYGPVSLTGAGVGAMTITGGGTVLPRFWIGCNGKASCNPDECGMKSMALKNLFQVLYSIKCHCITTVLLSQRQIVCK